jgi:hypothetical protein
MILTVSLFQHCLKKEFTQFNSDCLNQKGNLVHAVFAYFILLVIFGTLAFTPPENTVVSWAAKIILGVLIVGGVGSMFLKAAAKHGN